MPDISGGLLNSLVESKGWRLGKIEGSHHIYTKEGRRERLSIPVHGNKDLIIGLLRAAMKTAAIQENEL
ncbi:MAG: type II toxin-antitoxin system HicA family toxin [Nitrospirota bacterium]|nr:type II toxin-antitoxin system HicA family toxin [Nitrospirota bacterium]